jgi:putative copper resistance protein D
MARLLQIFGFLSVLFRGATLTFESLTIGGIVFLNFIVRPTDAQSQLQAQSDSITQTCLRWMRRAAIALALMQLAYILASTLILMQSADMTLCDVSGANFVLAGILAIVSALTVAALVNSLPRKSYVALLLPAALILASSVLTSHAMARLDYRLPLALVTALHQGATATWLGGLFYLLISIPRSPDNESARQLIARFSKLAFASVIVLGAAGLTLSYAYVGSVDAIYGTSYGIMVATKAVLFGTLLLLGALNYKIAHAPSAVGGVIASLKRFGEAEVGIGITVILTAASLTSLPPAVDLKSDRVSAQEISARIAPHFPRLASPSIADLPEDVYAAEVKSFEVGTLSSASFVPGQAGTRPNTSAEKSWSEYNHHWAGLIVLATGLLAFLAQTSRFPWARNWPLVFLGLAVFLFLRSDPETWPLGPNGFWVTLQDPEVLLHRIFVVLVIGLAIFEWRVQTGRVSSGRARLGFPALVAVASALLLTHSHALGNIKEEVLAELSHAPLAVLGIVAGWSRWLELRLPPEDKVRHKMAWLWPTCLVLIGLLLLNYREM